MSGLTKARLQEIDAQGDLVGDAIVVQFNPETLRLQLSNRTEGGESQGRQARQHLGASSSELSLELVFDTADEGTTDQPRSVREKTERLHAFVLPRGPSQDEQAPPRVRFSWGDFIIDGVIDSLSIDFDHFSASGVPLRAKVGLSLKEQNPQLEFQPSDAAGDAPEPGGGAAARRPNRSARALGGESAAEFAARAGLDPAAWRGLSLGGEASLSLSAGLEVEFNAGLSAGLGLGMTFGAEAGLGASLEASFGLGGAAGLSADATFGATAGVTAGAGSGATAGASAVTAARASGGASGGASAGVIRGAAPGAAALGPQDSAGLALAAAGGVSAAIGAVKTARADSAASAALRAFALPAPATAPATAPVRPAQPRAPLGRTGLPSARARAAALPAPRLPAPDPRAVSFGFGVPLRPRAGSAADPGSAASASDVRAGAVHGAVVLRPASRTSDVLRAPNDPTTPPWQRLPPDTARAAADRLQRTRSPACRCGEAPRPKGGTTCQCR
jgi:hypothetical protein